jgi:hypothetical protein
MKTLTQDIQSPGQDLNPGPQKYKAHVLTTQPQCLVKTNVNDTKYDAM